MTSLTCQLPQLDGYRITECLYSGTHSQVYRAVQTTQQRQVVIKILTKDVPALSEVAQMRNQYAIAKNLPIAGVVHPLGLEPYINGPALVMEDWGGVSLDRHAQPMTLHNVLSIGVQMAEILHGLHQHRVIHKDIKPANILMHPVSKQIKLIDFSVASVLPKETQELQSPQTLEGTLAYLSPEQTGRMNRGIDYRADFYALGVTLYQLLTGQLPFDSTDSLELVHCHLAKTPMSVSQINGAIPLMVSDLVARLMEKNAENRYQSALGLKHDLSRCLTDLKEHSQIVSFTLGEQDISDRFLIPERLYGRDAEVKQLLTAFDRVSAGAAELMLVAGFSGIGKTAVVNEVHKPIARQRGYFIKGKFDQFNRDVPLSAFVQALRDLMGQLLSESDQQLAYWHDQILASVGEAGQVLIEVIPELEEIIGAQPPAPKLSGTAEQNRFNVLFQKFISVFACADHPLVLFLDDLQWADAASLALIKQLMGDQGHLLVLGAYRDNEVSPAHPFMLTVEALQQMQVTIHTLTLAPLQFDDVNALVADTLTYNTEAAQALSGLINRKAKGNPFFITQFLKALHSEGQLTFDRAQGQWVYDIANITALTLTDDVVAFMAQQLKKLPAATQNVLKLAACVGNTFDLQTLTIISETTAAEVAAALWPALQDGVVLPTDQAYKFFQDSAATEAQLGVNPSYRFLHDRIQQAAASLIATAARQQTHIKIGRLLLDNTPEEALDSRVFDIVNHLNLGIEPGTPELSMGIARGDLARLNLMAGQKAKRSNAIATADKYLTVGLTLLPDNGWAAHYALTYGLHRDGGECKYLNGDFATSRQLLETALAAVTHDLDRAELYGILMNLSMTQGDNFKTGISAGLEGLSLLGLSLPVSEDALRERLACDQAEVQQHLSKIDIADLYQHTVQTDPVQNLIMRLLVDLWALAYLDGNVDLLNMTVIQIVLASLQQGNTSLSAFGYVTYAMNLAYGQQYQTAYQLARLALQLNEKFNRTDLVGKVNNLFCNAINPYNRPLATNLEYYQASYQHCMECGDVTYGVWALFLGIWTRFDSGEPLPQVLKEAEKYLTTVEQMGDLNMHAAYLALHRVVRHLQGQGSERLSLDDEDFNEAQCIARWQENNFDHGLNWYHYLKAELLYTYEQYGAAQKTFEAVIDKVAANVGFFPVIKYYVYYLLVLTALYPTATDAEQANYWQTIERHHQQLTVWANNCPENFHHQMLLAEAEIARISDRPLDAMNLYDQAIAAAQENQYLHHEALANELAAKFYLGWGKAQCAAGYLQAAHCSYSQWGAQAKVADLERRYGALLPVPPVPVEGSVSPSSTATVRPQPHLMTSTPQTVSIADTLDLAAVLKASQSLSSEIELDRLLATVLHTALETAGADRGILLMPEAGQWQIEAVATVDRTPQIQSTGLDDFVQIAHAAIHRVKRSQTALVIDNAATHATLANDAYVRQHNIKSVLCIPILRQGQLVSILYLENRVVVGAFTRHRVETLQMLAAQAAISLVNARLYRQVEQQSQTLAAEVDRQTHALRKKTVDLEQTLQNLQQTQSQLIQSEKMSAMGQLVGGVAHEINNPINFIQGNLNHAANYVQDLMHLLSLYQEQCPQPGQAIVDEMEEMDYAFVQQDCLRLFDSMKAGSERISQIVLSLRNFSRLDEAEFKPVNIHTGLESTLMMLQQRLAGDNQQTPIQVVKQFGELPTVSCYASQLNQVFFSVLSNAIDALREVVQPEQPPQITLTTELADDSRVCIRIADNGLGIPQEIRDRIFEPFFTTKPVGSGTGLGLSVSYAILKRHSGQLRCRSEVGTGTEIIIELPILVG